MVLSTRHSHICGWLKMFLATPANSEPGKERVKQLGEGDRVRGGRNQQGTASFSRPKKSVPDFQTV